MQLIAYGVSHHTADVGLREQLTWAETETPAALQRARLLPGVAECALVSTCNRSEIYAWMDDDLDAEPMWLQFLAREHGVEASRIDEISYFLTGEDVVRHLFRVASGLDSMVIGETQVLNQIKETYALAQSHATVGKMLHALFRGALAVGKRMHTETGISQHAVSVSYAAVELARNIFGQMDGRKVLLIGAGETAELTARYLREAGVTEIRVANRTLKRAKSLAEVYQGSAVLLEEVDASLREVDVIISSTGSSEIVLSRARVQAALPGRESPLFIVDIAVPRDVDPQIQGLEQVFLYDIDDLKTVVASNLQQRMREAKRAKRILEEEIAQFMAWTRTLDAVPLIRALFDKAEQIRAAELKHHIHRLKLDPQQTQVMDALTRRIVNKLLNDPVLGIKEFTNQDQSDRHLQTFAQLFDLAANEKTDVQAVAVSAVDEAPMNAAVTSRGKAVEIAVEAGAAEPSPDDCLCVAQTNHNRSSWFCAEPDKVHAHEISRVALGG